jgi:hypothetical protein
MTTWLSKRISAIEKRVPKIGLAWPPEEVALVRVAILPVKLKLVRSRVRRALAKKPLLTGG